MPTADGFAVGPSLGVTGERERPAAFLLTVKFVHRAGRQHPSSVFGPEFFQPAHGSQVSFFTDGLRAEVVSDLAAVLAPCAPTQPKQFRRTEAPAQVATVSLTSSFQS